MQDYQQRLDELYNELDDIAAGRWRTMAEIGKNLYRSHPSVLQEGEYGDLLPQIAAQNDEIARIAATVERLEEIGERMKVLGLDRGDREEQKEQLQEELRPHFRRIGEVAFRIFRENPLIDNRYTDIFKALSENYDEVRQLERELAALHGEQAKRPFVERLMKRGRDLLLKSRIQGKQDKRDALHEEAGRKLAETEFIPLIDDPDLNEAAAPYEELQSRVAAIDEEIAAIDKELRELNEEQQEKTGGKRLQRAFSDLRETREQREASQEELFSQLGRRFVEGEGVQSLPKDLESRRDELASLKEQEQKCKDAIGRLEAAVKVRELAHRIRQTDEEKERQQKKLQRIQDSIEELDRELSSLEEERKRMAEIRGAEEELSGL
jgi:chromosome segregation ATPase